MSGPPATPEPGARPGPERAGYAAGSAAASVANPARIQPPRPPFSTETAVKPFALSWSAARTLETSLGQTQ